jgi:hypothetical protein
VVSLYYAAMVAERFHISPTEALRLLDDDPAQKDLMAVVLLNYAAAKRDFDNPKGSAKDSPWKDTPLWERVVHNSFNLATEE